MSTFKPDEDGKLNEQIQQLKVERGYAKGNINRRCNLMKDLMKDMSNVNIVKNKLAGLEDTIHDFKYVHSKYHKLLIDDVDINDSCLYYGTVIQDVDNFMHEVTEWSVVAATLHDAAEDLVGDKRLCDTASNTSKITKLTSASRVSSIDSAKVKLAAKRASLLAEAATLQRRQELEAQELHLQQRKRELDVQVEIEKTAAEVKAYSDFEHEHDMKEPSIQDTTQKNHRRKVTDFVESWRANVTEEMSNCDAQNPHEIITHATVHQIPDTVRKQVNYSERYATSNTHDAILPHVDLASRPDTHLYCQDQDIKHVSGPSKLNPEAAEWPVIHDRFREHIHESFDKGSVSSEHLMQAIYQSQKQQQQLVDAILLPKTELQTFDGDPLQYWTFIRGFENSVERQSVDSNARLIRLLQYCTGKARKVIQCCAVIDPDAGYFKAKNLLKERFGNDYTIAEAWIQKVTGGISLKSSDSEALMEFSDELVNCSETLLAMHKLNELDNQRSLVLIVQKLPLYLQNRWKREAHKISKKFGRVHIQDVVNFVRDVADEANDPVFGKLTDERFDKHPTGRVVNKKFVSEKKFSSFNIQCDDNKPRNEIVSSDTNKLSCPRCNGGHTLFGCDDFKKLSAEERLRFVYEKKLCVNCLRPGHFAYRCNKETTCTVVGCGRKHTKFLHQLKFRTDLAKCNESSSTNRTSNVTPDSSSPKSASYLVEEVRCNRTGAGRCARAQGRIALPIVPVKVYSSSGGNFVETYALLDNGSTNTFCSSELINLLGIQGNVEELSLTTLDKENSLVQVRTVSLVVSDEDDQNFVSLPRVYSRPVLPFDTDNFVKQCDIDKWSHLQHIKLPKVDQQQVTLLIGQDVPDALVPLDVSRGPAGSPYATKTLLGWSLNGPVTMGNSHKAVANFIQQDIRLATQVETMWKLEACELLADCNTSFSIEDQRAVSLWDDTMTKRDGHYEMGIPFRNTPPKMPNNRHVAKYFAGVQDLLDKGYAEKIPSDQVNRADGAVWYLPHHPVFNDKKPDKVRIVFDCSAKYSGSSLNDRVLKGPDLMNNLVGVLIKFREEPVAIMSDIEAMFLQVKVSPNDRDALRFLWWPDNDFSREPDEYRMTVHLFGGVWSPSCASYALLHTADHNSQGFDIDSVHAVHHNFYVDDFLKSLKTEEQAIKMSEEVRSILACGGFRLTKWVSNSRNVLQCIPSEDRAKEYKNLDLSYEVLPSERVLGLQWNVELDTFGFKIVVKDKPLTKRGILSIVSSLYDPLGFVCPFVLSAKMILQNLCRKKIGWDDDLPEHELCQWLHWLEDLPKIGKLSVDRCIKRPSDKNIVSYQLHHFADASLTGYGVASYIRMINFENQVRCSFILAKSRLTPLKQVTIPRLELSAATLSVKLDKMIRREIDLPLEESVFWTDSSLVLQYIENEDKRFQTFVGNRLSVIHDGSYPTQWHYVDSKSNPADEASRGLTAEQMVANDRWLRGPDFLWADNSKWPQRPVRPDLIPSEEVRKEARIYTTAVNECLSTIIDEYFKSFSSWYRLKKSVAWILKIKSQLKYKARARKTKAVEPMSKNCLTVEDLRIAEREIVRYVQLQHFGDELKTLQSCTANSLGHKIKQSSSLIRLDPMLSPDGVLRVGGRLKHAPISDESKFQAILPKKCSIVDLIIRYYHELSAHAGREHVLSLVRQRYWILGGRRVISKNLDSCVDCKRRNAKPGIQKMADLPEDRVTPHKPPFTYVGVDFFGPFLVKRGRSLVKRYGCIFTCLAARAIHIEVTHSLDTSSFINALQRFISRRGQPSIIRSDNGTNFVGANKELRKAIKEWNHDKITDFLRQSAITWIFNPPAGSHMGGAWERQIRTIRKVMGSVLKQQSLDDESLPTFMCQVESIVNSRPITTVSDDPRDQEALTPNHLLLLRSGPNLPPGIFVHDDLYSRKRWRHVQYLADVFWTRWVKEYLPNLQQRQKWHTPKRNISPGDIVLLVDENTPRNLWPLGRVTETYPGRDGHVRTAQVKTQSSNLIRPIDKLCLLERTLH